MVVIEAEEVDTGMVDASGGAVPEFLFVGSGRATVFTDGRRVEGTWTRPTLASVATLTVGPGRPIELTPGRTWIQLVEAGVQRVLLVMIGSSNPISGQDHDRQRPSRPSPVPASHGPMAVVVSMLGHRGRLRGRRRRTPTVA